MADPLLRKKFPERGLNQAVAISAMCLQEEPGARPLMSDVVTALSFLSMPTEAIPDSPPAEPAKEISDDEAEYEIDNKEDEMYSSGSEYDDAEETDHEIENEGEVVDQEGEKSFSNSNHSVSRKRSLDDKSGSSADESNNVSPRNENETENVSSISPDSSNNNSNETNDGSSAISTEKSSKGSGDLGMKSLHNSSRKGSKMEEKPRSLKKKNRKRSSSLATHKRSKKSQEESSIISSDPHSRSMNSALDATDTTTSVLKNIKGPTDGSSSSHITTQGETSKSAEVIGSLHQNSENISVA